MASQVVDILMAQGRQAAEARRASAEIWGGALERLGQVPGEFQKSQAAKQKAQQEQQRLELDTAHLGLLQQEARDRAEAGQRTRAGQALTSDLVKQQSKFNPDTGHWEYNHEAILNGLIAGGYPEAAGHYADLGTKVEDMYAETQTKNLAFEARKRQGYADIFGAVAKAPEAEREARYGVMISALGPQAKTDPVLGKLPPIYPGHAAFTAMYDAQQTDAQRFAQHKEAADEWKAGLKDISPGGKLVHVGPTGTTTVLAEGGLPAGAAESATRDAEIARHNKADEGIAGLRVGREAAAEKERERHDRAMELHAAKAAAAAKLTKVEDKDPATGRTRIRYLPQSDLVNQTFQKGVGSTVESRLDSAQAVNQTGDDMIKKLQDPAYAAKVGPAMGRFNTLRDFIGNPPPEFAELAGSIESYSLANMGVHGMRSAQGAEQIKKLLDQKHTPASLIATIKGLNAFSTHFMQNEGRMTTPIGGGGNDIRVGGTFNGKKILKVEPVP